MEKKENNMNDKIIKDSRKRELIITFVVIFISIVIGVFVGKALYEAMYGPI